MLKHHEGTLKIFFRKLCCPECNPGDKELIPECKCPAYSVKENPPREAVLAGQTTHSLMQMICIPVLAPCLVTGWGRFMDRCLSSSTVNSPSLQCRLQAQGLWCWAAPACGQVLFRQHRNPGQHFSNGGLLKTPRFQLLFITP